MAILNHNIQSLLKIAQKPERLIIGLMSGTSLDGLDIALCSFKDYGLQTKYKLLSFITFPYSENFKQQIKQVFASRHIDLEQLCLLNAAIGNLHAEMILNALGEWNVKAAAVDLIASHGQTVYHAPQRLHGKPNYPNATLQIGDGDHIAVKTGIITISDFRQKHVAAGGEGAPLALYGDVILGSQPGEDRILLNIGGIANLTYLPADGNSSKIICTDVGPGNTLIDAACRRYFNHSFDEDGNIAQSGQINSELLSILTNHPFFSEPSPKTTGPELFNLDFLDTALAQLPALLAPQDIIATLSTLTAKAIASFIHKFIAVKAVKVFASGGGARNLYLIQAIANELPQASINNSSAININPDAKEAILFALLGNETIAGEPIAIGQNPAVTMGKISFSK